MLKRMNPWRVAPAVIGASLLLLQAGAGPASAQSRRPAAPRPAPRIVYGGWYTTPTYYVPYTVTPYSPYGTYTLTHIGPNTYVSYQPWGTVTTYGPRFYQTPHGPRWNYGFQTHYSRP